MFIPYPTLRRLLAVGVVLAASALFQARTSAQGAVQWEGSTGWSAEADHVTGYDPALEVRLHGAVDQVEIFRPRPGVSRGVRFQLRVGNDTHTVHLGPRWFVERQDFRLRTGDEVTVDGVFVRIDGSPVLQAGSVTLPPQTLRLRDSSGAPLWVGLRRAAAGTGFAAIPRWSVDLPVGDAGRGKKAFADLWCHACHVVGGHEKDFPAPYAQPPVPVVLGRETLRPSRGELVDSLINPSHRLEPGFQKDLVSAGKYSRMGDYNESMTLAQLSDLVAFLESLRK